VGIRIQEAVGAHLLEPSGRDVLEEAMQKRFCAQGEFPGAPRAALPLGEGHLPIVAGEDAPVRDGDAEEHVATPRLIATSVHWIGSPPDQGSRRPQFDRCRFRRRTSPRSCDASESSTGSRVEVSRAIRPGSWLR
jgi:hypothetical protein